MKYLKFMFSAVLLGLLAWRTDWSLVAGAFRGLRIELWLTAVGVYVLTQVLSAFRWQLLAQPLGFRLPYRHYLGFYFIGMFFNLVLPTSVGGDVVRAWYLDQGSGRRLPSFVSVLVDRGSGLLVLLSLACATVAFCPPTVPSWVPWSVWSAGGVALLGCVVMLFLCFGRAGLGEGVDALPRSHVYPTPQPPPPTGEGEPERTFNSTKNLFPTNLPPLPLGEGGRGGGVNAPPRGHVFHSPTGEGAPKGNGTLTGFRRLIAAGRMMPAVYLSRPGLILSTTLLSVGVQVANVLIVWLIGLGIGASVPMSYYWVVVPMVTLLTLLPVSLNGMGIREGGLIVFLAPVGVSGPTAVTMSLLWFAVMAATSLAGGVVYLVGRFPRPEAQAEHETVRRNSPQGRARQSAAAA
jgi:uncharacterized membrane protein YbhN (UPF0104 family)